MLGKRSWLAALACAGLLVATDSHAQSATTAAIAGSVRDGSGAVMPGVTVEAASPALIEKVRTVVTDDKGEYKIVDLRPGVYSVTFSLTGFSTVKREGVELSAGFTAPITAAMKVGSLEETITVTGATPIVDVQNSKTQQVMTAEKLAALPSGANNLMAFASMTLGAMPSTGGRNDVGGDKGEQSSGIILHGGRGDDGRTNWDGMSTNVFFGGAGGQQRTYYFNTVAVQEVVVDTGGANAETETGGANLNMVPKEGGNQFKFFSTANFTNNTFSAKAVPSDLKDRGIGDQSSLRKIYDYGVGVGGPLKRDKAWFYTTSRWWGAQNLGVNNYFNKSTNPLTYVPDLDRPAYADTYFVDTSFRATWQAAAKHKVNHEIHLQHGCSCWLGIGGGGLTSPEATTDFNYGPQVLNQTTWTYTPTNKLLIQGGLSFLRQEVNFVANTALGASKFTGKGTGTFPGPNNISILEQVGIPGQIPANYRYGALPGGLTSYGEDDDSNNFNQRLTVSYVTGSHAIRVGLQTIQGHYDFYGMQQNVPMVQYTFRAGIPNALTQTAGPFQSKTRLRGEGLFVQDQWTLNKLTLNYGARYDHFNGRTLQQDIPAGPFRPAFSVDELKNLPDFKDITYRFGVSYDVFGNGKTAIKGGWGKYLLGQGGSLSQNGFAPAVQIATSTNRSWGDANGNFIPDCDLKNFAQNGECGGVDNPLFGQIFSVQSLADDVREGWGNREYSLQWNLQLQQELRPGLGLAIGYFHTQWENMTVTRNTRVGPGDFSSYCITAPVDSRLGDASGQPVCGYYDRISNAAGSAFQITQASNFSELGEPSDVFDGIDIGINARWGRGALLSGGISMGREVFDFCYANSRPDLFPENYIFGFSSTSRYPHNDDYCNVTPNWWDGIGSQIKLQAVYPLAYGFAVSGTYKNLPGLPLQANYVLTTAQVSSILGRTSTAAGSATHALFPYQSIVSATEFDQRLNQIDMRLTKAVRIGQGKVQGMLDIYNMFNSRAPQAVNTQVGATFKQPTSLLGGRLFKFSATVDF